MQKYTKLRLFGKKPLISFLMCFEWSGLSLMMRQIFSNFKICRKRKFWFRVMGRSKKLTNFVIQSLFIFRKRKLLSKSKRSLSSLFLLLLLSRGCRRSEESRRRVWKGLFRDCSACKGNFGVLFRMGFRRGWFSRKKWKIRFFVRSLECLLLSRKKKLLLLLVVLLLRWKSSL